MNLKIRSIILGFVCMAGVSLHAQSLPETLKAITAGGNTPEAVSKAVVSWLDERGLASLQETIDAVSDTSKRSAAEWHAVALLEKSLLRHDKALEAWTKACASPKDATPAIQLALAHALARERKFNESLSVLETMDATKADPVTAHEVIWLLISLSSEGALKWDSLSLPRRMAEQRPDDLELQLLIERHSASRNQSPENVRRAKETLNQVKDARTRHQWLLFILETELYHHMRYEAATDALQGLAETAANSVEERQLLDVLVQALQMQGRSSSVKKNMPTEESVARQFSSRPAVVRGMAVSLRSSGSTEAAQKVLSLLPESPDAKKLISDWAEEDGRETLPLVLPRIEDMRKVETSANETAPPSWQQEIEALKDAERLKKLIQIWKAAPADQTAAFQLIDQYRATLSSIDSAAATLQILLLTHFSCSGSAERQALWRQATRRQLHSRLDFQTWWQSLRWRMGQSPAYWEALTFLHDSISMPALREADRLAPGNEVIKAFLARKLWRAGYTEEALYHLQSMTSAQAQAEARVEMALLDMVKGRPHAAARTMFEMAGHEALTPARAITLGTGLMAWREWADAALFFEAQRRRFPADYRLAYLHALALQSSGDSKKAEETFLQLGAFQQEISRKPADDLFEESEVRMYGRAPQNSYGLENWEQMQLAVRLASKGELKLSEWLSQQRRHDDLSEYPLTPPNVGHAGAWGMARLLMRAVDLPEPERQAWVEKARSAGLPMPELLAAGRIVPQKDGFPALKLDEEWIGKHLDLPWVCPIWMQQTASSKEPASQDAGLALKIFRTTLASNSRTALHAALRAWRLTPQSTEASEAVVSALAHGKPEDSRVLLSSMQSHLYTVPGQERRRAAQFLLPALTSVFEKSPGPDRALERRIMRECALLLGAWETAATMADAAQAASQTDNAVADSMTNTLVNIELQNPSPVLSWPPMQDVLNSSYLSPYFDGSMHELADGYFLNDEEKAAFAAAAAGIKDWKSKLMWLLSGSDEGARDLVRAWVKEQPHDRSAVLAAAGLAAKENDLSKALDLLYVRMQSQKKPQDLLQAQLDYLMSGIRTRIPSGSEAALAPPPKAHAQRLRQVAEELLPKIQKLPRGYLTRWTPVYKVLGMETEAESLLKLTTQKPNREDPYRNQPWLGAGYSYLNFLERSRGRHENTISTYDISELISAKQQARAQELLVRSLRQQADTRFSSDTQHTNDLDQWQPLIRKNNLAAATLAAAAPGQPATWRRLAQAVHIAEACEAWEQMAAWAEAALKLDATSQNMKLILAAARFRSGGDPAVMVEALHNLPPAEGRRNLQAMLDTAKSSQDFGAQLKLAQAVIHLAEQHPSIMSPDDGSMGTAVPSTFEILSAVIQDNQRHLIAPALYPEFERREYSDSGSKKEASPQAATPEQLEQRKKLFSQFCDVSLKHPEWLRETLRRLTARQIVEGVPEASVLVEYIKQGMQKEAPYQKQSYLNAFAELGLNLKDGSMRMRLARLALPLLETVYTSTSPGERSYQSADSNKLVQLIGAEIRAPKHPPLWALWECPLDVTSGEFQHTAEQLELNKERRALMDELWAASEKLPALRRQIFPKWAAYRLHFVDKVDEVLEVALKLEESSHPLSLLTDFAAVAVQSYENPHHVLSAELIEALLRNSKSAGSPDILENTIRQNINVLVKGRTNQADPMPPLYATPEKADKLLSKDLQERRLAVLDRLSKLLNKDLLATPELLFSQLEEALRQDKSPSKIIRSITTLAAKEPQQIRQMLLAFIKAGNGRHASRHSTNGYEGGAWELGLRVRWFSAALDVGKVLLRSDDSQESSKLEWLQYWSLDLSQPNVLAEPPVPPPNGMEHGHGGAYGSTALLYPKYPLLKKRDELLITGLELAMQQNDFWLDQFYSYTELQMARKPPGIRQLNAVLDKHCASRPEMYLTALGKWSSGAFKNLESRLAGADFMINALKAWPKNQVAGDFKQTISQWRQVVLGVHHTSNALEVPIVPGMPWMQGYVNLSHDWALSQPGAKERQAAWARVMDTALTVPGMFSAVFHDASRLNVEKHPEKIVAAAKNLSIEEWRQVQHELTDLYRSEERNASVERRLHWGKLVMQLLPMASAIEKYSPQESQKPTWAADTLKFLQEAPSSSGNSFRPPPPTVEILAEREALIKKMGDLLLDNPVTAVEGFESFAKQQFASGASPDATLGLARKTMRNDSSRLGSHLSHWCRDSLSKKETSAAERSWGMTILLTLAEEWPQEPAEWLDETAYLLTKMSTADTGTESVRTLRERLMNAALRLPPNGPVLHYYATAICKTKPGQQQLAARISGLLARDRQLAAEWMKAWWRSFSGPISSDEAQPTIDLLKAWPADASASELDWAGRLAMALCQRQSPGSPYADGWDPMYPNARLRIPSPPPAADAEYRLLQQDVIEELKRRKIELPSMTPLEMRMAGHSSLEPKVRAERLRALFAVPLRAKTLAYCAEVVDMDLSGEANSPAQFGYRPFMPGEQMAPHARGAEILDVSRCLLVAAQNSWLDESAMKPLRAKSTKQLVLLVSMAAKRAELIKNNPNPFTLPGVLESQGIEAQSLLDDWDSLTAKDKQSAVTPGELPRVLEARIKAGEKTAVLANLVSGMLKQNPAETANALTSWAYTIRDHRLPMPVFLATGRLAASLAERWTPELPPPDWLVMMAQSWHHGEWAPPASSHNDNRSPDGFPPGFPRGGFPPGFPGGFSDPVPRRIPPEETAEYEPVAREIIPQFATVLRRFPGCTAESYFSVLLSAAKTSGGLSPEETSKLALAHLQARSHSISRILLPGAGGKIPRRPTDPQPLQDSITYLLDQALQRGEHGELPPEHAAIIRAALKPEATAFYESLETLATCPKADFPKAASQLMQSSDKVPVIDCVIWILRAASFKKADITAAQWIEITRMKERFDSESNQERQLVIAFAWLRQRASMPKSDATQDARDLLHLLLGSEYSREKMHAALKMTPRRSSDDSWHGWPGSGGPTPNAQCRWAYYLMETMTGAPDLFKTNITLAHENGISHQPGAMAWLMMASRTTAWVKEDDQRWQGWLQSSGLLDDDSFPDTHWLLPHDGLAPVWEFAKACGLDLHFKTVAAKWLQEQQLKQPGIGRALLLLATQRAHNTDLSIQDIETALTPCRAQLQNAPQTRRAALAAALAALQPSLEAAVKAAPSSSVLHFLPEPLVTGEMEAFARRCLAGEEILATEESAEIRSRLRPLAAALVRLLQSGYKQTSVVMNACVKRLAKEKWDMPDAASHLGTEDWIKEHLGQAISDKAGKTYGYHDNGRVTVITQANEDGRRNLESQALCFQLQNSRHFLSSLLSSRVQYLDSDLTNNNSSIFLNGAELYSRLTSLLPTADHGEGFMLVEGLTKTPPPMIALEKFTALAVAHSPKSSLSLAAQHLLQSRKASITGMTAPALAPPEAFWNDDSLSPAALLSVLRQSNTTPPTAVRVRALQAWARLPLINAQDYLEYQLLNNPLTWLNEAEADARLATAADSAAAALIYWMRQKENTHGLMSVGDEKSLGQKVIRPLAAWQQRAGLKERRAELVHAAAAKSRLPLEIMLDEWRSAADAAKSVSEWLPLYFHAEMDRSPLWSYDAGDLPKLSRQDETWLAGLGYTKGDPLYKLTASLVLAALPDSTTSPPSVPRSERVRQRLELIDLSVEDELRALNRCLELSGSAEELLPELLPILRKHPFVKEWQAGAKPVAENSLHPTGQASHLRAKIITLWTAAEALHGSNRQLWTLLVKEVTRVRQASEQIEKNDPHTASFKSRGWLPTRIWEDIPCATTARIIDHYLAQDSKPPAELLPMWDELRAATENPRNDDAALTLATRQAVASGKAEGAKELLKRFQSLSCSSKNLSPILEQAASFGLSPAEKWPLLNALALSSHLEHSLVFAASIKAHFATPSDVTYLASTLPPEESAAWAAVAADWLDASASPADCTAYIRRMAALDQSKLKPLVWSQLQQHAAAHDDADLADQLQHKWQEAAAKIETKMEP